MYYILNEEVALRSWILVPHAYYFKDYRFAQKLSKEEFELLTLCDGQHDIPESELLSSLVERKLCGAAAGDRTLSPWQKPRFCQNRYFPAMSFMITGRCNFNCLHCFNAADNNKLQTEFTLEEALHLLDEAQACGIHEITITGGEPMLHPQFMKIMRGIYERDMYVHDLNTNGQFITQEVLDEFKTFGCDPLMKISFDGLGHHDWLRAHQGAEADAIRAIKLCIQNGFKVKVQTNVHRKNIDSILKTADYMDSLGVKEMRIIRTTESPRWTQNAGDACLDLEEYYDAMLDFTKQYLQKPHKMEIDIWQFLMFYPQHRTYHHRPVVGGWGPQRFSVPVCKGNRGMVAVASNGNVVPCHQMSGYYEQHGQCLGNVKTVGLQKLLSDSSYLDAVCTPVSAVVEHSEKCKNCKYLNLCLGGCRAIALALTGDKLAHDPAKCLFFNKGYLKKVTDLFNSLSAGEAKYRCMDDLGDIN